MPIGIEAFLGRKSMSANILQSVGKNGINRRDDVIAIQKQLNVIIRQLDLPPLTVDGDAGSKTITAIMEFQRRIVNLSMPDGRIDPNGRTLHALNTAAGGTAPGVVDAAPVTSGGRTVTYKSGIPADRRIVSSYAIKVIEKALEAAGMNTAVITSTIRLPAEQAEIMYENAAKDLAEQYRLYGSTGDQVIDVYKQNKTKSKAQVVELMKKKIEDLAARNMRVSLHVSTFEQYATLNIIDIGLHSTMAAAGRTFNEAKLTQAFTKLESEGYINKFIDETKKTNACWHLEIVPDAKTIL